MADDTQGSAQGTNDDRSTTAPSRRAMLRSAGAMTLAALAGAACNSASSITSSESTSTTKPSSKTDATPSTLPWDGPVKRYAIVGTGARHTMYSEAITKRFRNSAKLVGLCDVNPGRLDHACTLVERYGGSPPPTYSADQFDRMIADTKPDVVIVTTVDALHDQYVNRAMRLGCDALTEKPMTTTAPKVQSIIDTSRETGKGCRVTFNYRYSPSRTQLKQMLMSGVIGDVMSVDFHWMLDTSHGADYFRRWHSDKSKSGGLMVHKASHHFDLVNWWLSAVPTRVMASGDRAFYTAANARRFGLRGPHQRCYTCDERHKCGFAMDLSATKSLREMYLENEHHDGYHRDQCVWRDEISIEDRMNVIVDYDSGARLSYSLNAACSWEGYTITFNGTLGRIEHQTVEASHIYGATETPGAIKKEGTFTRVYPLNSVGYDVKVATGSGGHGGGDDVMLRDIFRGDEPDAYLRAADYRGGAYAALVGIAANECFKTGQPVKIADMVTGLTRPDYPAMPDPAAPLPMPRKG